MPRTADHHERRRQIATAVCELISHHGLDAVTVARTAATAGISVGLVQHYFRTKDDMLLHAFQQVTTQIRDRVNAHVQAGARHHRPIAGILAEAMTELLPLDAVRRTEFRVTRAFAGRTLDVPALAEVDVRTARALRDDLAQAIHNGKECGEVAEDLAPRPAAVRLAAVTEGLAMQVYRTPETADEPLATSIIRSELATVFTGECHQYT
ncbi:TetR/AcrR family transcriptional regulator [Actinomadura kijaniata]|uniref:AcrR family transcriptional regulator n=1 Tax=Actinomadura namibiensis TaxID=182080 RepID=A0A7W3QL04_ACTNM|nr:TetR/AcrR family transcriptional regulator [Actinomadura namibiensis]MBA8950473.1 AcrR family transcriptional regulator [Actinomadura namibiensis]